MRNFFIALTRNPVSLIGSAITTASAVVFVTLFAIDLVGEGETPYMGILAYLIVPLFFVVGLVLIPLGILGARRRARKVAASGPPELLFPVIDLNRNRTRTVVMALLVMTSLNVVLLATATYKGVEVMDSTKFCGRTCHTVMQPEFTAYQRSPHSHVKCVSCHIGPGGSWFVRSKVSGSWQVLAVAFKLYPRPIPVPFKNLRPARDTCGQCHWPARFTGDRLKVITHYADDESVSPQRSVLLLHIGGSRGTSAHGAHWHADPGVRIRYRADVTRETIGDVELTNPNGRVEVFQPRAQPAPAPGADGAQGEWRVMDCLDCHNRPAHKARTPEREVDEAIEEGLISRSLPFVRRAAVRALRDVYVSHEEARKGVAAAFAAFYKNEHQDLAVTESARIEETGRVLADIYCRNVFPAMKVTWGTYPDFLGHADSAGCFRCHDESHVTKEGKAISQDCALCHAVLAMDEKDPRILKTLQP